MRGDGVGVGDIGEVPGVARSAGDTAGDDDGGGAGRERDAGVVGGLGGIERGAWTEPGGDRVGVGDGARGEHGACDVHGQIEGGSDRLRGDGVGVGDIDRLHVRAWHTGQSADHDLCWCRRWQRVSCRFVRCWCCQYCRPLQSDDDWQCIFDNPRGKHGSVFSHIHWSVRFLRL